MPFYKHKLTNAIIEVAVLSASVANDYEEVTAEEVAKLVKKPKIISKIKFLKEELAKTDYQAIKFAEGWITAKEYAPIKARRQELRDKINALEEGELEDE